MPYSDITKRRSEIILSTSCAVDDILMAIEGSEANEILVHKVCERARKINVKFNPQKFQFKVHEEKYLCHILSGDGVRIDPENVPAILKMPIPDDKQALRRFLGMVRFLAQYILKESSVTAKLRELLRDEADWTWTEDQQRATDELKKTFATAPVLALVDHTKDVVIQADASTSGFECMPHARRPTCCICLTNNDRCRRKICANSGAVSHLLWMWI